MASAETNLADLLRAAAGRIDELERRALKAREDLTFLIVLVARLGGHVRITVSEYETALEYGLCRTADPDDRGVIFSLAKAEPVR